MIVLNGTEEEVKRQREAMEQRRLEAKQAKLAAKVLHYVCVQYVSFSTDHSVVTTVTYYSGTGHCGTSGFVLYI